MAGVANHMRTASFLGLAVLLSIRGSGAQAPVSDAGKKSGDVFKNLKVLNDAPSDLLLPSMQFITSSLGVHCEYCHVEHAFEKDGKKPKQTAREMMRMVEEINKTRFQGKQEVTCYSCHRGSPKPLTVPVIASVPPRLASKAVSDDPPAALNQPSPQKIILKYVNARGGTSEFSNLSSLEEHGTFESDARRFPMEIYGTRAGRSATVIHLPGADRITALDGTSGWLAFPGRPTRAMTSSEADIIRFDSDLQFGADLNRIFTEIEFKGFSKVGTGEAVVLSGERAGFPPVEMYFDNTTGLLVRTVFYAASALGLNPTQTDYSDYRRVGSVRLPFHWTSSTPTGRFSVQLTSVQANANIPEKVFLKPAQ